MRVLFAVFSLFVACHAYDAVLFSNQREIGGISAEQLVTGATPEEPIVFIVNPDFTLGQFSVKANAYSGEETTDSLAQTVKNSNFRESQYVANTLQASSAQIITSADQYESGAPIYIIAGEEWTSMEQLAESLIGKIDNSILILTSTDAVSATTRVKRVATDEMDGANSDSTASNGPTSNGLVFPMLLPPYNVSGGPMPKPDISQTCLMYLEGVTIVVQQKVDKVFSYAAAALHGGNLTYSYAGGDVQCPNGTIGNFLFRLRIQTQTDVTGKQNNLEAFTIPAKTTIDVSLNITGDLFGYWSLTGATANDISIKGKSSPFKDASSTGQTIGEQETQYSKINSVAGWSLVCGQTQAVFFPTNDENVKIGFALLGTQIQTFNQMNVKGWNERAHFTLQTEDCQGTFSAGSWMGIVSALVLIAGLLFGYVMLQSVQTMDRFDDPKQKQIVINVRE